MKIFEAGFATTSTIRSKQSQGIAPETAGPFINRVAGLTHNIFFKVRKIKPVGIKMEKVLYTIVVKPKS